ncbi:MAG: AraC-like DNA-binding protein [Saprospiraceae bacterium]|jgi:AraC-like DNA-binding protein
MNATHKQQHATLERVEPTFGQSFTMLKFDVSHENKEPFWHFHPELELVYIADGSSKRHIGNHLSYYNNGDLILIGPNLPHFGFTDRLSGTRSEIVLQWKEDFLGAKILELPESEHIKNLFKRSKQGIVFYGNIKEEIGTRLEDLIHMEPFERLMGFIKILHRLATSEEYRLLNASTVGLVVKLQDSRRIDTIYKYVRKHFMDEELPLKTVAGLVNMTVPSFCRYFKKHTRKTFTQFVNEFRIVHATKLLSETDAPISDVCFDSGFNNFSHFNRNFRKITGKSPREYRSELAGVSLGV